MQLLRNILKMFCSQHLPLQSNVLLVDVKSFVIEPPLHILPFSICVNLLGLANGDGITSMLSICITSCCIDSRVKQICILENIILLCEACGSSFKANETVMFRSPIACHLCASLLLLYN